MKLFGQSSPSEIDPAKNELGTREAGERLDVFLEIIRALFIYMHEFTLDISEIDTEAFRKRLEALQQHFLIDAKTKTRFTEFGRQKEKILSHIQRQKAYIYEREGEYKEIIDLMAAAMSGLDNKNRDFYSSIRIQGERFEEITLLDDIKRIKSELAREVDKMRCMIRDKEENDQDTLDALSNQVAVLRKELDRARHSADTDGLTGLYNRKALDRYLLSLVERNTVTKTPFAILMMDLDDFKQLNDTYGHVVGDRVLMAFANKCRQLVRSDDFLARYGGEEFTLVLPGASLRNAAKKAKQLCGTIAAARYAADDSPNPDVLSISASIGVSVYTRGDTVKSIVDRADQCLYKAKKMGKNRVIIESDL